MVKFSKFLLYVLFFLVALYYFFPKTNVYYLVEQKLSKQHLVISNEKIADRGFTFELSSADIFYNAIKVAKVDKISLITLGVYNQIDFKNIKLEALIDTMVPSKIEEVELYYTAFSLWEIKGDAKGDFGKAVIVYNMKTDKVSIELFPSKLMLTKFARTLQMMKKTEEGTYRYETILTF